MRDGPAHRRRLFIAWRVAVVLFVCVWLFPVASRTTKLAGVVLLAFLIVAGLVLFWKWRLVRNVILCGVVGGVLVCVLPGRDHNESSLRARYVTALQSFEGVRYVWGGENFLGVDCSGLVRKALVHACWKEAAFTLNPRLVRAGLSLWWFDTSAKALGNEHRAVSKVLALTPAINQFDHAQLRPGDFAVMGIHTMAYLGEGTWIEADPSQGRVIRLRVGERNPWLQQPTKLVRWWLFEGVRSE